MEGKYKNLSAINIFMGIIFETGPRVIKNQKIEKETCLNFFANFTAPANNRMIIMIDPITLGSLIEPEIGNLK